MRVKTYFSNLDKELLNSQDNSHCVVPISVGQKYHEDKRMESTLDLINRSFKKCTILVCDTLQRYSHFSMINDKTFEEVTEYSLKAGDEWIKRNQPYIDKLTIPTVVERWDMWLDHKEFNNYKHQINSLYLTDDDFKRVLDGAVLKYVERLFIRDNNADLEKAKEMSMQYLKEESAIFFLATKTNNFNYFIYPTIIDLLDVLFEKLEYKNLCHRCYLHGLNFKKSNILT